MRCGGFYFEEVEREQGSAARFQVYSRTHGFLDKRL